MNRLFFVVSLVICHFIGWVSYAQYNIPAKPTKVTEQVAVYDYANILNAGEEKALETKLIRYSDTTSTQIVIATIQSLKGEDIAILTPKWAHQWGIGDAKKDNGVFILLSKNDRKIHISPGYGVEQYLTAGQLGELVRSVIIPEFKAGGYYNGLNKGTTAIIQMLSGTYKGTPVRNKLQGEDGGFPYMFFIILAVFLFIIWSKKRKDDDDQNSGGRNRKAQSLLDIIILSNMGRGGYSGGGSFGGSSGGGFGGGFGGGGFSGGGAGGSW